MRSFNYVRTRFKGGEDFVSDAPDEIARDVATLLGELPPLTRSLDVGALSLPEQLGTLVHLRAGAYAGRVAFVHAIVLAGPQELETLRGAEQLLLSRYGRDGTASADRVDALCEELRELDLREAAGRVSELFVDSESLAGRVQTSSPRRAAFFSRRRRSGLHQLRVWGEALVAGVVNGVEALRSHPVSARLPEQARSVAADLSQSLTRGNTPWIVTTAAWTVGAFLLGIGVASGQPEPAKDPEPAAPPTLREARAAAPKTDPRPIRHTRIGASAETERPALPHVRCGPQSVASSSSADDRILADALLAAIARLEALDTGPSKQAPAVAAAPPPRPSRRDFAASERAPAPPAKGRAASNAYASVVADFLIVRAGPGTEFPRLARLPGGTAVRAARGERDGWTRIGEPVSGWVASQYLSAWAAGGD